MFNLENRWESSHSISSICQTYFADQTLREMVCSRQEKVAIERSRKTTLYGSDATSLGSRRHMTEPSDPLHSKLSQGNYFPDARSDTSRVALIWRSGCLARVSPEQLSLAS